MGSRLEAHADARHPPLPMLYTCGSVYKGTLTEYQRTPRMEGGKTKTTARPFRGRGLGLLGPEPRGRWGV